MRDFTKRERERDGVLHGDQRIHAVDHNNSDQSNAVERTTAVGSRTGVSKSTAVEREILAADDVVFRRIVVAAAFAAE